MDSAILASSLHFILAFVVVGALGAELVLLRPGLQAQALRLLVRVDLIYGLSFGALVAVGIARVVWTEKGWGYYQGSATFWVKMALLLVITLASLPPTFRYIGWNRRISAGGVLPTPGEITGTRRWLWLEATLLLAVPLFAAMMARGV